MILYHATTKALALDTPLNSGYRSVSSAQLEIETEIDSQRPKELASRFKCCFAGDSAEFCAYYLTSEEKISLGDIRIYRIGMDTPTHHPMALISFVRCFAKKKEIVANIAREYWKPKQNWKCWEYISDSMTPIANEPTPDEVTVYGVKSRYAEDFTHARKLWPNNEQLLEKVALR